jgi:hypothetical protein
MIFWLFAGMSFILAVLLSGLQAGQGPESAVLSRGDKLGLTELFRLKKEWGDRVWPGFAGADIPLILFNDSHDFLVGAASPAPPWETVEKDNFEGKSIYRRAHDKDLQAFAVPYGRHWAGSMATIEFMNRGQSPIKISPDFWVVLALHEMFHAFQANLASKRFKGALAVYAFDDRYTYKDKEFAASWNAEGAALFEAIMAPDDTAARRSTLEFLRIRQERRRQAGLTADLLAFERELEWLEGLAKFAEIFFYESAAAASGREASLLRFQPRLIIFQMDFLRLKRSLGQQAGDLRFYLSGMAQARLLDRLKQGWMKGVPLTDCFLEDLLQSVARPEAK